MCGTLEQTRKYIIPMVACLILFVSLFRITTPPEAHRAMAAILFEAAILCSIAMVLYLFANKYVGLFLILAMVSHVVAVVGDGRVALLLPFFSRPSYQAFHFALYGCLLYGIIVIAGDESTQKTVMDMMCLLAIANAILLVLQRFGIDPLYSMKFKMVGFMGNPNEVSALLAFCFPAFLRKKWAWFIPLVVCGFISCVGAGGPLSVASGLVVFGILTGHYLISASAVIGGLLFCIFVHGTIVSEDRLQLISESFKELKGNWLFGHGIGRWKIIFLDNKVLPMRFDNAHNEYVQGVFEMGVGFIVLVFAYFLDIARRFKNNQRLHRPIVALVIISVNSLVNFPFHIAQTAAVAIMWLAVLELELRGIA